MTFPTGDSKADKSARLSAASVTLQNLNGRAVVSTTFPPRQKAIGAGIDVVSSQSNLAVNQPAPAHAKGNGTGVLDAATIRSLAPTLGFQSGINPTGTGDCNGAVNGADGEPIKVPCSCPPPQNFYIEYVPLFPATARLDGVD